MTLTPAQPILSNLMPKFMELMDCREQITCQSFLLIGSHKIFKLQAAIYWVVVEETCERGRQIWIKILFCYAFANMRTEKELSCDWSPVFVQFRTAMHHLVQQK